MKVFVIEARTGCSCCSSDNHYRGFYYSKEDAERRISYFKHPDSKYWPLASQYARRGNYSVEELDAEELSDGRLIINDRVFQPNFISVDKEGKVWNNEEENIGDIY